MYKYFVPTYHHNSQNRRADATKHETFPHHRHPLTSAWRWTTSEEEQGSLVSESYLLRHQQDYEISFILLNAGNVSGMTPRTTARDQFRLTAKVGRPPVREDCKSVRL